MALPLLLLPGMMCDARMFAPQVAALSPGRQVTVAGLDAGDTMETLAATVLQQAPRRFALAGVSMGGIVAMEVLRQAPDRVDRIALLDTNHLAEPPDRQALRDAQIDKVRAGGLRGVMRDEMKPNYLAAGPGRAAVLDLCMEMAMNLGPEVFVRQSLTLRARRDQSDTLAATDCPALVLCGRADTLCPVARHEAMAALIPGAALKIIEGAGHLPVLEKPDETTAALKTWLEED